MINQENAIFQNIDEPNTNPLNQELILKSKKFNFKFNNKKNILIVSLFALFIVIIVVSLAISLTQKSPNSLIKLSENPTPIQELTPSPSTNIPAQFQENFSKINAEINTQENFLPPEIDPDLGLK